MSTDREKGLAGLREQAGGIDPAIEKSLEYAGAVRELGKVVKQQGQVASAALANNHQLYHTNKSLVADLREARAALRSQELLIEQLQTRVAAAEQFAKELEAAGGDKWKPLYEHAMRIMTAWNHAEMDATQLAAALEDMKAQAKELAAQPETLSHEEILRRNSTDDGVEQAPPTLASTDAATRAGSPWAIPKNQS